MDQKQERMIMFIIILALIIAMGAISLAAFNFSRRSEKLNTVTTGTVHMSYEESDNTIEIENALPISDEIGTRLQGEGEYFDFSIHTNTSRSVPVYFEIAAEDLEGSTLPSEYIKYYLTKVNSDGTEEEVMAPTIYHEETESNPKTGRPKNLMSLYVGTKEAKGETVTNYRLRIYISDSVTFDRLDANLTYKTRINVYGKVGL